MLKIDDDTLRKIAQVVDIDKYVGLDLTTKPVEECAELIKALMDTKTYKSAEGYDKYDKNWRAVYEEASDVIVTILVMVYRLGGKTSVEHVTDIVESKLERTIDRYEKGEPV